MYLLVCVYRIRFAGNRGLLGSLGSDVWVRGWGAALRWEREEAERTVKPQAPSELPVLTAQPSASSAAQAAPPCSPWDNQKAPRLPSQDPLSGVWFSSAIGLGLHPSPTGRSGLHRHTCTHSLVPAVSTATQPPKNCLLPPAAENAVPN